jgi:Uma2 family endonuclease
MAAPAVISKKHYSFKEYLQLEQDEGIRYEYHKGEVFAMAGGSMNHSDIANNITSNIKTAIADRGCRAFQEGIKVEIGKDFTYVYPDVVLTCNTKDLEDGYIIRHPLLVAEVLSPSTENYDRGTKSIMYRKIPSLRYYLLVSQNEPLVQLYSRNASTALFQIQDFSSMDDIIQFPELNFTLSLSQIYYRIKFEALPLNHSNNASE